MTDFIAIQENYLHYSRQLVHAQSEFLKAKKYRDDHCPHTETTMKRKYVEGGYLDKGYEERWNECTVCGAKSEVLRESDGHYG